MRAFIQSFTNHSAHITYMIRGSTAQSNLDGPSTIQPSQPANRLPVQTGSHVEGPVARFKHGLEDDDEFEKEAKKTRVEGDEFIDGDEDAEWRGSDSPSRRAARHKRGKRVVQASTTTDEDGDTVSTDPLCLGRRIGEEWHVGNVWYKVGPNGQRLRRANVKSRQPAFHMVSHSWLSS